MSKRLDSKGRVLQTGESQRTDGRYTYKYVDAFGKEQFLYSWKLVHTDRLPKGKRNCLSLREKKAEVIKDKLDGIDSRNKKITLCELYQKQNISRANVTRTTIAARKCLMDILKQDKLGARTIDSIKPSDAKEWAIRMQDKGYAYQSINNYKRALTASYHFAIADDYVRKNPFNFRLDDVIKNDTKQREILTKEQEKALLDFILSGEIYRPWYDSIVILINTGLRISELCELTITDIDFEKKLISIDHQLLKDKNGYYISLPKTSSGVRQIPMNMLVGKAFKRLIANRNIEHYIEVDGYSEFIFLNKSGFPMVAGHFTSAFKKLVKKYNKKCGNPEMPNITPHGLRHTFCTNMANLGMTPNNLQYIMGHKNITMTLGYYAHGSHISAQTEMNKFFEN